MHWQPALSTCGAAPRCGPAAALAGVRSRSGATRRLVTVAGSAVALVVALALPVRADEPISPLPLDMDLNPAKVALGQSLFQDTRLSGAGGHACASCHMPEHGGSDGLPTSFDINGNPSPTNSLSIFNTVFNYRLNWDGHNLSSTEQVADVVQNPVLMAGSWPDVVERLGADGDLAAEFRSIYPEGVSKANIIDAIVEYERSLTTPNAPFDKYLRGDETALSAEAAEGYRRFKSYGCTACHQGVNIGGNMMQVFGVFGEPPMAAEGPKTPGSSKVNRISSERPVFRVPSLRNVAMTAPYFHDGSVATLPEAINIMAEYQLGRPIDDETVGYIVAFLNSLTGEYQGVPLSDLADAGQEPGQ